MLTNLNVHGDKTTPVTGVFCITMQTGVRRWRACRSHDRTAKNIVLFTTKISCRSADGYPDCTARPVDNRYSGNRFCYNRFCFSLRNVGFNTVFRNDSSLSCPEKSYVL